MTHRITVTLEYEVTTEKDSTKEQARAIIERTTIRHLVDGIGQKVGKYQVIKLIERYE